MERERLEQELNSATPSELIVKMYEGALGFLDEASAAHELGDAERRGHFIGRAIAIVSALRESLDVDRGGIIARNLDALYFFIEERLILGTSEGRMESIEEAVGVLRSLLPAWSQIASDTSVAGATVSPAP